jgi:hypothetical protein
MTFDDTLHLLGRDITFGDSTTHLEMTSPFGAFYTHKSGVFRGLFYVLALHIYLRGIFGG